MQKNNTKQYVIIAIIVLAIMIVFYNIIKNINLKNVVSDYKNDDYIENYIENSHVVRDREIYYSLENILLDYIASYNGKSNYNDHITHFDYYNCLESSYKKYLGYDKYIEKSDKFLSDFYIMQNVKKDADARFRGSIKSVYTTGHDEYMCEVKLPNMEDSRYFGVMLNEDKKTFKIFYIG